MLRRRLRVPRVTSLGILAVAFLTSIPSVTRAFDDDFWSSGFALPDVDGTTRAGVIWNGALVVGGSFNRAGTAKGHVAFWDGVSWQPLGSGLPNIVSALVVHGGDLYAATSNAFVPQVWRWDGANWISIGTLATSSDVVNAMTSFGGALVVGGKFASIAGITATNIAKWDGASWTAVGGGTDAEVRCLVVHEGALVAAGSFGSTGSGPAAGVAAWDGSTWSPLGSGINLTTGTRLVTSMVSDPAGLYVTGRFDQAGGAAANGLALWSGATWQAISAPFTSNFLRVLGHYGGDLLAWQLTLPGGRIGRLSGGSWNSLQDQGAGTVTGFVETGGRVVALGGGIGGSSSPAEWDGVSWTPLQRWEPGVAGIRGQVYGLAEWNNMVVASGVFRSAGAQDHYVSMPFIGAWDGSSWHPLGTDGPGLDAPVGSTCLRAWNGDLVMGGYFTIVEGTACSGIARWDGLSWQPFGAGLSDPPYDAPSPYGLDEYQGDLVVSGEFSMSGSTSVRGIARWDGAAWQPLGVGFNIDGDTNFEYPLVLLAQGTDLFAGGVFTTAGGIPAAKVARWDGAQWHALGAGVGGGDVYALIMDGGTLVVGGDFQTAGGGPAVGVARWDGTAWQPMGNNAIWVYDFAYHGGGLYASGEFLRVDQSHYYGIAHWNGYSWETLGSGVSSAGQVTPWTLLSVGDDLYLGGDFDFAGGKPSVSIARWTGSPVAVGGSSTPNRMALAAAAPNPASTRTTFAFTLPTAGHVKLTVSDVSGRRLATLLDEARGPGRHEVTWDGVGTNGRIASGVYVVRLETPAGSASRKLAWIR